MAERPERRPRRVTTAQVRTVERITPHMIRVVLGGPGLEGLVIGEYTDHYIKLQFPAEGEGERPRTRTYTVRAWDAGEPALTVDLVHHGDVGLAGPWAASVRPGDEITFGGPGGGYAPDPAADWHLLAGDESALPAIAASLERLEPGARAHVFVEVAGPEEEQKLETAADAVVTWLHRGSSPVGERLVRAVTALDFPAGDVHAFVHGEAGFVKELRRLLLLERGVPRDRASISGYWRLDHDEDGWQAGKRDWNRQVELEQDGPA
ncbi:siderophore-interacting protein [Actinocorallia longicatena]|uniref:Siderophore-interacting protein n=1 Tax=Actinocorallia longicatena TaxID=111803 RepID=A0ABP6Q7P0_9ACTN